MAILSYVPIGAYKKLENQAAALKRVLQPIKTLSRGYSPFPWAVIAHVTYRCNLDCEMCCQHIPELMATLPAFPKFPVKSAGELPVERWKAIIDDVARSFPVLPFFHFSGGEPFLYPGLLELVAHARSRGLSTSVITNGWTLAANAGELVRLGVDRVNVSIDGPEEVHDLVRRMKTSFRRAVTGIRALRDAREKAGTSRPFVTINTTVTPRNFARLEEMLAVQKECGADALTVEHLIFLDNERSLAEGIDVEELRSKLGDMERRAGVTVYPRIPDEEWQPYYRGSSNDLGTGCGMLWTGMRIHPNGDVGPCRSQHMGSLADGSATAKQIWNNAAYRASRSEIARVGNVEECGRCEHRLY